MRILLLPLLLAACGGAKPADITVTVSGVGMPELESVRGGLESQGATDVRPGALKDGKVTITVRFAGKGSDLAAKLAAAKGVLRDVKGFDDTSVQVVYASPLGVIGPTEEQAKGPPAKPEEKPVEKEIKVDAKKDPLAYRVHQLQGGTIATFEGWKIVPVGADGNWTAFDTTPPGKEQDFVLRVVFGTPNRGELESIFTAGPELVRQFLTQLFGAGVRRSGEQKKCTFGGDEAMVEEYAAEAQGKKLTVRVAYIKKKDVAVAVLGIGTEAGIKEFGRAIEITAQSISFQESPLEPALVGTWALEKYTSSGTGTSSQFSYSSGRYVTIYPNGAFSESTHSSASSRSSSGTGDVMVEGGDRGRIVKRGSLLTFHYDDGKTWSTDYRLDGGQGLWMGKTLYLKQ